jgi:hypothetical protein
MGATPFLPTLSSLLQDPEPSVRRLACQSVGRLKHPKLVNDLVAMLKDRSVRDAARQAMAKYGDDIVDYLARLLDDRSAPLALRLELPRILSSIGTARAVNALLFSNIVDNATLRYRIAQALFDLMRARPDLPLDAQRVDQAAQRRLRAYRHYRGVLRAFERTTDSAYAPLIRALRDRVSQNLEMALRLVGLKRDPERMQRVFAGLDARKSKLRAEALELVDVALAGDPIRAVLLKHLEEETLSGQDPEDELRALLRSRDPLLRGLAEMVALRLDIETDEHTDPEIIDMEGERMDRPLIERILLLENVDLFANLSMDDVTAIAAVAGERVFAPGATIYREGAVGDAMFVIVRGAVELLKGDSVIMTLRSGESLVLERTAFMDLLSDRFELVNGLFAVLAQRLRALIDLTGSMQR